MYFVLAGEARIEHGLLEVGRATVGDHFGELALLAGRKRKASVVALTDLEAARLGDRSAARRERQVLVLERGPAVVDHLERDHRLGRTRQGNPQEHRAHRASSTGSS